MSGTGLLMLLRRRPGEKIVDATTGTPVPPLDEGEIRAIAKSTYTGSEAIASVRLITEIPGEMRGRKPPLWRVEFDNWNKPTLYFCAGDRRACCPGGTSCGACSTSSGCSTSWTMMSARTSTTRCCATFTWGAVLMALSGVWLLFYSFHRKKKKKKAVRA